MKSVIQRRLLENEEVLWEGNPAKGLGKANWSGLIFMLIWNAFFTLVFVFVYYVNHGITMTHLIFVPFGAIGLYTLIIFKMLRKCII